MPEPDLHRPPAIPDSLASEYASWRARFAYSNGPDTATWQLSKDKVVRYLKLARRGWTPSLDQERVRMEWARGRLPVPRVLAHGQDASLEWFITEGLPGVPGSDASLLGAPSELVPAMARGLRALHDTPADDCPFSFRVSDAMAHVSARVYANQIVPSIHFHPEHLSLNAQEGLERLEVMLPTTEDLVLCHGDYCVPNVLLVDGQVTGYLDLGFLALADRWWDLAVATWSLNWNLGPGWEDVFLEEYGAPLDPGKRDFYRLLYDMAT